MTSCKRLLLPIAMGMAALSFLLHPQISAAGISRGLSLCVRSILPTLFPFFVLSNLWVRHSFGLGRGTLFSAIFHLPAAASNSWLIGALAGYPTGAKSVVQLYENGQLTKEEANQALLFCCNAGPAFVIGVLGSLFHSLTVGLQLYLLHLSASVLLGIVLRPKQFVNHAIPSKVNSSEPFSHSFVSACQDAIGTIVQVCGFLLFFCVITAHLQLHLPQAISSLWPIVSGFLELTNGSHALAESTLSESMQVVLSSALLGWGGLCVHAQTLSFLPQDLSAAHYLFGKALHGFVSLALSCLTQILHPIVVSAVVLLFLAVKSSTGKTTVYQI